MLYAHQYNLPCLLDPKWSPCQVGPTVAPTVLPCFMLGPCLKCKSHQSKSDQLCLFTSKNKEESNLSTCYNTILHSASRMKALERKICLNLSSLESSMELPYTFLVSKYLQSFLHLHTHGYT